MISQPLTMGQGEYLVLYRSNGKTFAPDRKVYEKAYQILTQYAPMQIAKTISAEHCINRYNLIMSDLKKLDPNLEAVFIPRTLYELVYIRQCIEEECAQNLFCRFYLPQEEYKGDLDGFEYYLKEQFALQNIKEKRCWHLGFFSDEGDVQNMGVKEVAYQLNQIMVATFNLPAGGFSQENIDQMADAEIEFLKGKFGYHKIEGDFRQPTACFCLTYNDLIEMGIRNERDAGIIKNAVRLECSEMARHSLFLYRGGSNINFDSVVGRNSTPNGLSYGTSLFAGCVNDSLATAFFYMRKEFGTPYAIPVPFDKIKDSPFHIPQSNTVAQLFGDGQKFHAWTKSWKNNPSGKISRIDQQPEFVKKYLQSNLSKEELDKAFNDYKSKAILL